MAVKIRLARAGAKKNPYYHIVAADSQSPRDGKFLEELGGYAQGPSGDKLTIKADRLEYWLKVGGEPTERVAQLIKEYKKAQSAAVKA